MKTRKLVKVAGLSVALAFAGCNSPAKAPGEQQPAAPLPAVTRIESKIEAVPDNAATSASAMAETKKEQAEVPASKIPVKRVYAPEDQDNPIYMGASGRLGGRGDRLVSEAYRLGQKGHTPALEGIIYKDKYGLVDWVAMVDKGMIKPRASLDAGAEEVPPLDMDIVIAPRSESTKAVVFAHRLHTYWNSCTACHDKLFAMAKGESKMNMKGIAEGKWCGACHGKVAFPIGDCVRCHTKKRTAAGG